MKHPYILRFRSRHRLELGASGSTPLERGSQNRRYQARAELHKSLSKTKPGKSPRLPPIDGGVKLNMSFPSHTRKRDSLQSIPKLNAGIVSVSYSYCCDL